MFPVIVGHVTRLWRLVGNRGKPWHSVMIFAIESWHQPNYQRGRCRSATRSSGGQERRTGSRGGAAIAALPAEPRLAAFSSLGGGMRFGLTVGEDIQLKVHTEFQFLPREGGR